MIDKNLAVCFLPVTHVNFIWLRKKKCVTRVASNATDFLTILSFWHPLLAIRVQYYIQRYHKIFFAVDVIVFFNYKLLFTKQNVTVSLLAVQSLQSKSHVNAKH